MKALLICPSESPAVGLLSQAAPLSNLPLLGQSLLEYWLSRLACSGLKQALVLAHDRPDQVRTLVGNGTRWGLDVTVAEELCELRPAQALLKYARQLEPAPVGASVVMLDHLPGLADRPLFTSYADWFAALQAWMPRAITPDRVGARELRPGVWVGLRSCISPRAQLRAPCWVGSHTYVGAEAVIGPHSIVEDGAFIEPAVEIVHSYVSPNTFVAKSMRLVNSLAWGDTLLDWQTGTLLEVPEPFLLRALCRPKRPRANRWPRRVAEVYSSDKSEAVPLWKQLLLNKGG
jgi:NDP-sugar pyrophosphorylase family protein